MRLMPLAWFFGLYLVVCEVFEYLVTRRGVEAAISAKTRLETPSLDWYRGVHRWNMGSSP